jgi:hypothetical protein
MVGQLPLEQPIGVRIPGGAAKPYFCDPSRNLNRNKNIYLAATASEEVRGLSPEAKLSVGTIVGTFALGMWYAQILTSLLQALDDIKPSGFPFKGKRSPIPTLISKARPALPNAYTC